MFFAGYSALVADKAPTQQKGEETIEKLVDQVQNCSLLEDRRAAILGLRGLARDWKLVRYLLHIVYHSRINLKRIKSLSGLRESRFL